MLPNRFALSQKAEETLKKEKQKTGISPNIYSRELFFLSVENRNPISLTEEEIELGNMQLEKTVWLGGCQTSIELLLTQLYPGASPEKLALAWAKHVEDGLQRLRAAKPL